VLSPSSILPPPPSRCALIAARKNSARVKKKSYYLNRPSLLKFASSLKLRKCRGSGGVGGGQCLCTVILCLRHFEQSKSAPAFNQQSEEWRQNGYEVRSEGRWRPAVTRNTSKQIHTTLY
jgi:hypothetical protein